MYDIYREQRPSSDDPFVVCAFITAGNPVYCRYADRLIRSCERFSIPYTIYSLPTIHKSISKNGSDDLRYTKPAILLYTRDRFKGKNILYLDGDLLLVKYPQRIMELCGSGVDFSVYNWLNDSSNEAYKPARVNPGNEKAAEKLFRYSHHIPYVSDRELFCSGGTQFYANTPAAQAFLIQWQEMIKRFADSWDDEILNFTFNNFFAGGELRFAPMEKSYLRLPWWPHVDPVILHPEFPSPLDKKPPPSDGTMQMYYPDSWIERSGLLFGQDCIIDIEKKKLLKIAEGTIAGISDLDMTFYVYPYNYDL